MSQLVIQTNQTRYNYKVSYIIYELIKLYTGKSLTLVKRTFNEKVDHRCQLTLSTRAKFISKFKICIEKF